MVVPSPPPPSKRELRVEGLKRRRGFARSLAPALRAELEAALAERVLPHLAPARIVGAYHPLRDEISPDPLLDRLGRGRTAAFPWFAAHDERMIWRAGPAAEPSPWGVLQPSADAPPVRPEFVIVPLVLADRRGTRIGHGQGHYDRALAHLREAGPVFVVGIGWEAQIFDGELPRDSWDVPLDAVATPGEWIACR
jgi:5-formyltetrahydrofolate cyclo-ligase